MTRYPVSGSWLENKPRVDDSGEEVLEEESSEKGHAERLPEPVDEQNDQDPLRSAADTLQCREVDPQHHRIDHQPDQDRDREVDVTHLFFKSLS